MYEGECWVYTRDWYITGLGRWNRVSLCWAELLGWRTSTSGWCFQPQEYWDFNLYDVHFRGSKIMFYDPSRHVEECSNAQMGGRGGRGSGKIQDEVQRKGDEDSQA